MVELDDTKYARAIEANHLQSWLYWGGWPKLKVVEEPHLLWTLSDIPLALFNNIFQARLPPDRVKHAIREAQERARYRKVPIRWWVTPSSTPADQTEHLRQAGFELWFEGLGMARTLDHLPPPAPSPSGLVIERISDLEALRLWCDTIMPIYDFPKLAGRIWYELLAYQGLAPSLPGQHLIAYLEGEAVATASLFVYHDTVGLSYIGTHPNHRRRGIATAITHRALELAQDKDCRLATLYTSKDGVDLFRGLGFRKYCQMECYIWAGEG